MLKLLRNLKPFRLSVAIITLLVFIQTLTQLYLPTLMADIVDQGVVNGDTAYILKVGAFMLVIALIGGIATIFSSYQSSKVGMGFGRNIREKVFKKVTHYSLHEMDEMGSASLITRSTNDITQVQNIVVMLLRVFLRAPIMAIGSIIIALQKDVPLTMVIFGVLLCHNCQRRKSHE